VTRRKPRADAAKPAPPARSRSTVAGWILVLVLANAWAYSNSFGGVFLLDDIRSIALNPNIRALWPLTQSMAAPAETTVSGRPIPSLTLAINYALAPAGVRDVFAPDLQGTRPAVTDRFLQNVWGYHAINLAIHVLATLTLFGVLRRTLERPRLRALVGGDAAWLAFGVALLWSLHPLQTESVTYVVQRVESLMGLFFLLTLYCSIRAAEGSRIWWWTGAAIACCALGMASKAVMVGAPLVVFVWDLIFGERLAADGARRRWILYGGLAATWLVLAAAVVAAPRALSVGFGLRGWTAWTYLLTQCGVIVHYLRLAFVPSPLVLLYDWPRAASLGDVAPQAVLLVAGAAATLGALVRRHPLGFLGAWFFVILAPTSSVLPIVTEVAAEHRMYLPLAAIVACVIVGGHVLLRRATGAPPSSSGFGPRRLVVACVFAAVALWLGAETGARNLDYVSEEHMWLDVIQKHPDSARAHAGYGIALVRLGRYSAAERELRTAVGTDADNALSQANLGAALVGQGRFEEAIGPLDRALAIQPDYADAHHNLGLSYAALGRDGAAAPHLASALQATPDDPALLNEYARILGSSNDPSIADRPRAVELATRAVRVTSGQDINSLNNLAAALAAVGDYAKAVTTEEAAVALARSRGLAADAAQLEQRVAMYRAMIKVR
jgi:Tfp pilus assembly protein PilF